MSTTQHKQLTLISHKLCPYVQRAVIALEQQGKTYKRIDVDLNNPPDWFKRLSPLGKVPVLLVDDETVLFESAVIAEYINDIGNGKLLARRPIDRARQRAWIEFASATLDTIGSFYNVAGERNFARVAEQLRGKWRQLEQALGDSTFFSGEDFSLVDAAFAPVFRYLDLFEQLVDFEFLKGYPKISRWRRTLGQLDVVRKAVGSDYQVLLAEFVAGRKSYLARRARVFLAERLVA